MNTSVQRRIASDILGCGIRKVWMDKEKADEISMAITRDDIRKLIKKGTIKKKQEKGVTHIRAQAVRAKKIAGRRVGHGTVKGKKTARNPPKRSWMKRIRTQRERLAELREGKKIERRTYRKLYMMAKGGAFRSLSQLSTYIEEHNLTKVK